MAKCPNSALRIKEAYADFDAERRFGVTTKPSRDAKSCECPSILRGEKKPTDCKLFGTVCTPDNPIGSCMVSSEGACAAYWTYGRFRQASAPSEAAMTVIEARFSARETDVPAGAVEMVHGSGGRATAELVRKLFLAISAMPFWRRATTRPLSKLAQAGSS